MIATDICEKDYCTGCTACAAVCSKGAISIVGPTRMQYSKIIPLLEYIANNIKKIM